jgi:hypothetical protein
MKERQMKQAAIIGVFTGLVFGATALAQDVYNFYWQKAPGPQTVIQGGPQPQATAPATGADIVNGQPVSSVPGTAVQGAPVPPPAAAPPVGMTSAATISPVAIRPAGARRARRSRRREGVDARGRRLPAGHRLVLGARISTKTPARATVPMTRPPGGGSIAKLARSHLAAGKASNTACAPSSSLGRQGSSS